MRFVPSNKEGRLKAREFYIPKEGVLDPRSSEAGTAYSYENAGRIYAIGFAGSAAKPSFHYRYSTPEKRAEAIDRFFESIAANAKYRAETKAKAAAFKHTLKVGDVVHTSWGYDQTNVSFFEVVRVVSEKSVGIRKIASDLVQDGPVSGKTKACPGKFVGEEKVCRVREGNVVVNAEYSYSGYPGGGEQYTSWGH